MRMIRAVAIMLALTVTITLAGCVSYVDLSDRAIVQAIGIDYLPDKKVYRISMCSISINRARADRIR